MPRDIDIVINRVRALYPDVNLEQLKVSHPGIDDDGLWFFSLEGLRKDVQVESSTGTAPFTVEHGDMHRQEDRVHGADIDRVVAEVASYLGRLKREAPLPTPACVTPAAGAPVAPPPGVAGL